MYICTYPPQQIYNVMYIYIYIYMQMLVGRLGAIIISTILTPAGSSQR